MACGGARQRVSDRRIVAALVVALLGLLALTAYSWTVSPAAMRLGEIDGGDVGRFVEVRGHLRQTDGTAGGGVRLLLVDLEDFSTLRAYLGRNAWTAVPDRVAVSPGAEVVLRGELRRLGSEVVLDVASAGDLRVVAPAAANLVRLETLASRAADLVGMNVTAVGVLAAVHEVVDPLRVRIGTTAILWATAPDGAPGLVDVCGTLEFDRGRSRWELRVAPGDLRPHGAGTGCTEVSLEEVVRDPEAYAATRIGLSAVPATRGEPLGTAFDLRDGSRSFGGILWGHGLPDGAKDWTAVEFQGTVTYDDTAGRFRLESTGPTLRAA